jgi:hypothetical protein
MYVGSFHTRLLVRFYDFYSVSPEYFGFTLVLTVVIYRKNDVMVVWNDSLSGRVSLKSVSWF